MTILCIVDIHSKRRQGELAPIVLGLCLRNKRRYSILLFLRSSSNLLLSYLKIENIHSLFIIFIFQYLNIIGGQGPLLPILTFSTFPWCTQKLSKYPFHFGLETVKYLFTTPNHHCLGRPCGLLDIFMSLLWNIDEKSVTF